MVRRNLQTVSDERVRAATGEARTHWFALLDAAGAHEWRHGRMAEFLADLGVPAWWAQSLTVAYEQERGLRLPGQRPDGTFDANASRTLRATRAHLWPLLTDDAARASWLAVALPLAGATEWSSVRLTGPEGSRVTFWLDWLDDDGDPGGVVDAAPGRVRVSVQHARLASFAAVEEWKPRWKAALAGLADQLDTQSAAGAAE